MLSRWILPIVLLAATIACDKVPLSAPSTATIVVTSSSRSVGINGTAEITAIVSESAGTPVQNGTTVRFTTTLGTVDPVEAQTANGIATTTLRAGLVSGVAQVRANSGAAGGTATTNVVEVSIGAATAATLSLSSSSLAVPSSGGTVTLRATVADAAGNRVAGVAVTFTTTAGTLSNTSPITDAAGEAISTLTTDRVATVTARVGAGGTDRSANITITPATVNNITIEATPATVVQGAPMTLRVTPTTPTGTGATVNPVRVVVNWGDGSSEDLGLVTAVRSVSHTYSRTGTFTIVATATGDGESSTVSTAIVVTPRPMVSIAVSVSPSPVTVGAPVTLTVTPTIPANTTAPRVSVAWGDGTTDDLGTITTQRTTTHVYSSAGIFTVTATATADGETTTGATSVVVNPRPPLNVNVSASISTPAVNVPVTFTATATEGGAGAAVTSYVWRVDSNTAAEEQTVETSGNQFTRSFGTPGTKTVRVTVNTQDGRSGSAQTQVVVP